MPKPDFFARLKLVMRIWINEQITFQMNERISIIGVNECSGHALMGAIDTFKAANVIWKMLSESNDSLFDVQVVSQNGTAITCSNSYTVSVDGSLDLVKSGDGIVCIPFAMASSDYFLDALAKQSKLIDWLRQKGDEFEFLGAISVGVFLLADAGLLEGRSAAAAWWFESTFKQRHPDINIRTDSLCVKDANILSSGSVKRVSRYLYGDCRTPCRQKLCQINVKIHDG